MICRYNRSMKTEAASVSAQFPARLRAARETAGLSLVALASRVGYSEKTLRNYEHGRQVPTIVGLEALAWALETTVAELLG